MSGSARVLVINDDPEESGVLTQKLHAHGYFSVPHRENMDALDLVRLSKPDVVIISGRSDGNSNLNLTRALKSGSETTSVPIILIAASDSDAARADGLRAGADACLPFPYHDLQLFGRVESLARLGTMQEELHRRTRTAAKYGLEGPVAVAPSGALKDDANFLIIGPTDQHFEKIEQALISVGTLSNAQTPATGMSYLERRGYDAILLNVPEGHEDGYFLLVQDIRRNARLFNIPIVVLMAKNAHCAQSAPYSAGAADVFRHPIDTNDLRARVEVLVRQQRYRDSLIEIYSQARHVAISDALTGLYSHGFLMEHLCELVAESHAQNRSLTIGMFTLENLAEINSEFGYTVGDKILRQVGLLISNLVRGEDLSARFSGNRFALVMPETRLVPGEHVAHRIGSVINYTELMVGDLASPVRPQVSTGVASLSKGMSADALVKAAIASGK